MKTTKIAVMAALVAGMFATQASASTLNLVGADETRGSYVTVNYSGTDYNGFAGPLLFTIDGGADLFSFFCVDLTHPAIVGSPYEATPLPPSTLTNGAQLAWLYTNFVSSVTDVVTGTALQLALWDVVYDGGDGLNTGLLTAGGSISSSILNQAASYITASTGQSAFDAVIWKGVLGAEDRQMQIGQVPEPGSIFLLGSGLALAAWRLRRKA